MFGYVNILKDELKIKEYNIFRAYYCGLCKRHGKLTGQMTRLALSYDFAVLAVFLDSIAKEEPKFKKARCMLHPTAKRDIVCDSEVLDYCAYMSVALTYYKIKDDITDKSFSKYTPLLPVFAPPMKKIKKRYAEQTMQIVKFLDELSDSESQNCKNIDEVSSKFGHLMGCIFDYKDAENKEVLKYMGYTLGRWIYIIDAIDDFAKDEKKGSYNPFSCKKEIEESLPSLWYNLSETAKAYELLDIKRNKGLTDNIIYYGLKAATHRVLKNAEINQNGEF